VPEAVEVINTTVSPRHRTISLLLDNGETARFALLRKPNGDVYWSLDMFTRAAAAEPLEWSGHIGRLTVDEVVRRLPACENEVIRWTADELEDGPDIADLDIFARDARGRALERLRAELGRVHRAA
jgi:hypothetical protein